MENCYELEPTIKLNYPNFSVVNSKICKRDWPSRAGWKSFCMNYHFYDLFVGRRTIYSISFNFQNLRLTIFWLTLLFVDFSIFRIKLRVPRLNNWAKLSSFNHRWTVSQSIVFLLVCSMISNLSKNDTLHQILQGLSLDGWKGFNEIEEDWRWRILNNRFPIGFHDRWSFDWFLFPLFK